MPGGRGFPSNPGCLTSTVLRYLVFGSTRGLISFNIAAHIFRGVGIGVVMYRISWWGMSRKFMFQGWALRIQDI